MHLFGLELVANMSILFAGTPLADRPRRAKDAGFEAVEAWWPFNQPDPSVREVGEFIGAITNSGIRLVALNMFGGYAARGDRGLACRRERHGELRACLPALLEIAQATGCAMFNCPYGQYDGLGDQTAQDEAAVDALTEVAQAVGEIGGRVLLEPIYVGEDESYPLRSVEDVLAIIDGPLAKGAVSSVGVLCDLFHLGAYADDIVEVAGRYAGRISHVQVADYPGRHEPGTGTLPLRTALWRLARSSYRGYVSCEYVPRGNVDEGLDWIRRYSTDEPLDDYRGEP
jgi:hydroxypyruvate isomerase